MLKIYKTYVIQICLIFKILIDMIYTHTATQFMFPRMNIRDSFSTQEHHEVCSRYILHTFLISKVFIDMIYIYAYRQTSFVGMYIDMIYIYTYRQTRYDIHIYIPTNERSRTLFHKRTSQDMVETYMIYICLIFKVFIDKLYMDTHTFRHTILFCTSEHTESFLHKRTSRDTFETYNIYVSNFQGTFKYGIHGYTYIPPHDSSFHE